MNLSKSLDRKRLFSAIQHHYKVLEGPRRRRRRSIEQMAGDLFQPKERRKTIMGLMRQAYEAHVQSLAPRLPISQLTARNPELAAFAGHFGRALNMHTSEIRLGQTLQAVAGDSFFGSAFVKLYLAESLVEVQESLDVWVDPGKGFAERKSLDDIVFDTFVSDFRKVSFTCDRYSILLDVIKEDKQRFSKSAREALLATKRHDDGESRFVTTSEDDCNGRYVETIDLVDVYIPHERRIYTFASDDHFVMRDTDPLQVIDWNGGDEGPYKHLNLGTVPDNLLSSGQANYLYWLDVGVNQVWRKLLRQMERMKVIGVATPEGDKDVSKFNNAKDGEVVSGDPETIKELRYGGPDNQMIGSAAVLSQMFDRMAGNLTLRAGLGASTGTVGQDQMLGQQASRLDAAMQTAFKDFTCTITRELGRMLWDDPASEYVVNQSVPGSSLQVNWPWQRAGTDGSRQGSWSDYDFDIDPTSYRYREPAQRAMELRQITAETVQLLPMMMQTGVDVAKYIDTLAELHDLPRLREIFAQLLQPPADAQQSSPQQMQLPGQKPNGNYTRTNATQQDPNTSMIQQMLSSAGEAA